VIDDGELARIRDFLKGFGIEPQHLRGDVIREDLEGPFDLVIASVKRTLAFEDSIDLATLPGKPVWIAVHAQDFLPLRVRLQRMGVQYLVQSSVGSEALQLLLVHSLYRGPERRDGQRLPVGMPVGCRSESGADFRADLLDLTHDSCRLLGDGDFEMNVGISIELPGRLAGGEKLLLQGRVARIEPHPDTPRKRVTVEFHGLPPETVALLEAILQGKVIGTVVTRLGEELAEATSGTTLPAVERTTEQSESEAVTEPAAEPAPPAPPEYPHKRNNPRTTYERDVTALLGGSQHVILGRDLSIGGMRSEPLPELAVGTELELAIYGSAGAEPVLVKAVVARDDGELGTVFHFTGMQDWERPRLEAIVNSGSEIQSLSGKEAGDRVVVTSARERVTIPRRRR
jgi:hypothetical protein